MTWILRKAATKTAWSGEAVISNETRARARADFTRREVDSDGISVFQVEGEPQELLVVAAIACGRRRTESIDLLRLSDALVREFGEVTRCGGETPIARANDLHGVLDWTPERLTELVDRLLAEGQKATRYPKTGVIAAIRAINLADISDGEPRQWAAQLVP